MLPVDRDYNLRPTTRRRLRSRMRLHGFDLLAPACDLVVDRATWRVRPGPGGTRELRLVLARPRALPAGAALALPLLPADTGGVVGARIVGRGRPRLLIQGEPVPGATPGAWRLKVPLLGRPVVRAGATPATISALTIWSFRPQPLDVVDRYPIHLPLDVGAELRQPLVGWRRRQPIEQLQVHWGSVEYRHPERRLPLGAWGFPYYLDTVLGDVFADTATGSRCLARGKVVEMDELESIRGFAPLAACRVRVRLRPRDRFPWPPRCRVAAIEVRYRPPAASSSSRAIPIQVERWVRPGRPLVIALPGRGPLLRLDVEWGDRGPALGALQVGRSRSRWTNVCNGERHAFGYLFGARPRQLTIHARLAPLRVGTVWAYYQEVMP